MGNCRGQFSVPMRDQQRRSWTMRLPGRWLIEPNIEDGQTEDPTVPLGTLYGVALLADGRLGVYVTNVDESLPTSFNTERFTDYRDTDLPLDIQFRTVDALIRERHKRHHERVTDPAAPRRP